MTLNLSQIKPAFMIAAMVIAAVAALKIIGVSIPAIKGDPADIAIVSAALAWIGK